MIYDFNGAMFVSVVFSWDDPVYTDVQPSAIVAEDIGLSGSSGNSIEIEGSTQGGP